MSLFLVNEHDAALPNIVQFINNELPRKSSISVVLGFWEAFELPTADREATSAPPTPGGGAASPSFAVVVAVLEQGEGEVEGSPPSPRGGSAGAVAGAGAAEDDAMAGVRSPINA